MDPAGLEERAEERKARVGIIIRPIHDHSREFSVPPMKCGA